MMPSEEGRTWGGELLWEWGAREEKTVVLLGNFR
jgi:hypothetical protein